MSIQINQESSTLFKKVDILHKIYKDYCRALDCSKKDIYDSFKVLFKEEKVKVRVYFCNLYSAKVFVEGWDTFAEYGESFDKEPYFVESLDDDVREEYIGIFSNCTISQNEKGFYLEIELKE